MGLGDCMSKERDLARKISFEGGLVVSSGPKRKNIKRQNVPPKVSQEQMLVFEKQVTNDQYVSELYTILKDAKGYTKELENYISHIEMMKERASEFVENDFTRSVASDLSEIAGRILGLSNNIYEKTLLNIFHESKEEIDQNSIDDEHDFMVKIYATNDVLIVKTPLVKSRYHKYSSSREGAYVSDYGHGIASVVERKLKKWDGDFPDPLYKKIDVIEVFDEESMLLPDADNLDTKKIIDALSARFTTKDSSPFTTISFSVVVKNDLEPGTYFIVYEMNKEYVVDSEGAKLLRKYGVWNA